jgi:hypothetical protein
MHNLPLGELMALQDQVIPIDAGMGLDTKTDPKLVVPGKFVQLENAVFTNAKRLSKRNGYSKMSNAIVNGTTLVSPQMIKSYGSETVCVDQGYLYSYSQDLDAWIKRGPYISTELSESFVWKQTSVGGYVDSAYLNGQILYTWQGNYGNPTASGLPVYIALVDANTGSYLIAPTIVSYLNSSTFLFLGSCQPRAVVLGSGALAVTYYNTVMKLVMRIITTSAGSVSYGPEIIIEGSQGFVAGVSAVCYDVANTSTGAVFTAPLRSGGTVNALKLITVDTAGNIVNTATLSDTTAGNFVFQAVDPSTGNVWLYYNTTDQKIKYAIYSSVLASVLAPTVIATGLATLVSGMCAFNTSSLGQVFYFTAYNSGTPAIESTYSIGTTLSGTGVSAVTPYAQGVRVCSRAFFIGTQPYAFFYYCGGNFGGSFSPPVVHNTTFFLATLNTLTPIVTARFFYGDAVCSVFPAGGQINCTPNVSMLSATKVLYSCAASFQFLANQPPLSATDVFGVIGGASVQIDFASPNINRATAANDLMILNGACVSMYDGLTCAELGFHLPPEVVAITNNSGSGGSVAAGTYRYQAVFQWTDSQGNFHESAPSNIAATTVSTSSSTVSITVTAAYLTQKSNVTVALYRTKNNGTVYYQVTDPIKLNSATGTFVTITDALSDSQLDGQQFIYTNGGVLDNDAPPPSMIIESRLNRLYMVDSETPNQAWYSKSYQPGYGIGMSLALYLNIDPKLGPMTALAELDDKLVFFKQSGLLFVSGDGANDAGTGSTFSQVQTIPSDAGCDQLKSVIVLPLGVLRHTSKGFYLLDRSLNDKYFGAEVESFNTQTFTAATLLFDKNQVRFLTASGNTLVYDYIFGQWGAFTNHQGYSADVCNGVYVYARTDGKIFKESTSTFLDDTTTYQLLAKTGWIAMASVQGLQRIRRIGFLGDYLLGAGHGIQVSAAYDFSTTFSSPVAFSFPSTGGAFQYRERLPQQKCDAVQILIQEITTGASGEYVNLTNMSFEAGIKRGLNKMSAAQSVG